MYDNKHRLLPITTRNTSPLKLLQKGIKEHLLCKYCEVKLSRWEPILKRSLVDIGNLESRSLDIEKIRENFIKVNGLSYKEIKLCLLSILWRMSISSNDFYSSYNLGPYEEKIRKHILEENYVSELQYPISITRYELDGEFTSGIIAGFPPGRYTSIFTVQQFIIWGHLFKFFVNDLKKPPITPDVFLRETGQVYIDIQSLKDLVSSKSVVSRLFDKDVNYMFNKKMKW